jgi:hypothetical protein
MDSFIDNGYQATGHKTGGPIFNRNILGDVARLVAVKYKADYRDYVASAHGNT